MGVECTAIIPARGGSKGLPGKNLAIVGGRSLVARAVHAATRSERVGEVVVSTDDDEIAAEARLAGAEIVRRPDELASDDASSEAALLHALEVLAHEGAHRPDLIAFIQCTSPFVTPADIDGTVERLLADGADAAFTVVESHRFLWRVGPSGAPVGVNHEPPVRLRRQDTSPEFAETGAVYVMRRSELERTESRFCGALTVHEVPSLRALEIDTAEDLDLARAIVAHLGDPASSAALPREVRALVLDFDGVITDNKVLTFEDGTEAVRADRSDGMGIEMLRSAGIRLAVISKERNRVVAARCEKLGVEHVQGVDDKLPELTRWCDHNRIPAEHVVYAGNDVNDVECLRWAGCGVAVSDARSEAKANAQVVLRSPGGHGAVRELADLILRRPSSEDSEDQERDPR